MFAIDYGVDNRRYSRAEQGCPFRRILPTKEMKQIDVITHMFATLWLHPVCYIRLYTYWEEEWDESVADEVSMSANPLPHTSL